MPLHERSVKLSLASLHIATEWGPTARTCFLMPKTDALRHEKPQYGCQKSYQLADGAVRFGCSLRAPLPLLAFMLCVVTLTIARGDVPLRDRQKPWLQSDRNVRAARVD